MNEKTKIYWEYGLIGVGIIIILLMLFWKPKTSALAQTQASGIIQPNQANIPAGETIAFNLTPSKMGAINFNVFDWTNPANWNLDFYPLVAANNCPYCTGGNSVSSEAQIYG